MMLKIDRIQHSAGQGGFHTGRASVGSYNDFCWMFDCGSRSYAKFNTLLKDWTARTASPVHWLFISHFDQDHVSGLETLMSRTNVRDVMVPYVNDRELVYQLLFEISRGNIERSFFELVADPGRFFLDRGADRVSFLRGGGSSDELTVEPDRPRSPGDRDWGIKIRGKVTPVPAPRTVPSPAQPDDRLRLIDGSCEIIATRGTAGIRLKPYRAPLQPRAHLGLVGELQQILKTKTAALSGKRPGLGELAFEIARHARSGKGQRELRALFAGCVGSSNRSSLSLLSTPLLPPNGAAHWIFEQPWFIGHPRYRAYGPGGGGWMNTGDAELLSASDLQDWANHYGSDLTDVAVLALPHHGSDRNSGDALQALCPDAKLVAHAREGSSKHPGAEVRLLAGDRLAVVTRDERTTFRMYLHAHV